MATNFKKAKKTRKPTHPSIYSGNQVILNSDRLIFNAKEDSILLYSDKAIGFSTNGSIHFDTGTDKNLSRFIVNTPNIYLGLQYDNSLPTEPAVKGDTLEGHLHKIYQHLRGIYYDLSVNVSFLSDVVGGTAEPNPDNQKLFRDRWNDMKEDIKELKTFKSEITKIA